MITKRISSQLRNKTMILVRIISIVRKDQIWHYLEVIAIPKSRVGAKLVGLYCFEKIDAEDLERTRLQQLAVQAQRDQGTGRPTKKERREIDDLNQETSEEEIK
jgi:ribosome-associated heat shock protein Hsp15